MLHLARKAFYPAPPPFPFLHIATGWDFRALIEHRDRMASQYGLDLLVHANEEAARDGINPFETETGEYSRLMLTEALKESSRHGEWADIKMPDGVLKAWVVYPERAQKAGVVLVIHDIRGMSDMARAMGDQLAQDGFIAIVPDFLSGKGPNGGGTDFSYMNEYDLPGGPLGRVAGRAVSRVTQKEVDGSLQRLKQLVE